MTATSIPLGDAPALRGFRRRTRVVRIGLGLALALVGGLALLFSRTSRLEPTPILPPGSNGVVVLDLSASTENATLDRMYAVLDQLGHSKGRFGLVVFSSRAYEALAPNTPAKELLPVARFFKQLPPSPGQSLVPDPRLQEVRFPTNPWASAFSFGTAISEGLDLARTILLQSTVENPAVWLVSDLADAAQDKPLAAAAAREYIRTGVALHVIGLDPLKKDERFFSRLVGPRGSLVIARPPSDVRLHATEAFPTALVVVACLLAVLLAANELLSTPLRWGRAERVVA